MSVQAGSAGFGKAEAHPTCHWAKSKESKGVGVPLVLPSPAAPMRVRAALGERVRFASQEELAAVATVLDFSEE